MKKFNELSSEFRKMHARNEGLKKCYATFEECLKHLSDEKSGLNGIAVTKLDNNETSVSFLGKVFIFSYEPNFSTNSLSGNIIFSRVIKDGNYELIKEICFNDHGLVDYPVPENEDPITLDNDPAIITLVLNLLYDALKP